MKNIVFSDHAKDRLQQRGIKESQVRATLEEPHSTMPALPPPRQRRMRDFGQRTLDVIYIEHSSHYFVITAAWLTEHDRPRK